ncbi:hypothetical protein [Streptomyces harbinensis]|uniref:hypothetical protein n=1 Tax=Streptomyces harbinensis TaxID=1176198 RepID=UPI0034E05538
MSRTTAYLNGCAALADLSVLDSAGRRSPVQPVLATPVTIVAFAGGVGAGAAIVAAFEAGRQAAGGSMEPIIT